MKISKSYGYDKESRFIMDVFDDAISKIYYKWPLERIDVMTIESERGDVSLEGNTGKIIIGKENAFVKKFDRKGVETIIILKLYSLIMKIQGTDFSEMREKYYLAGRDYFEALLLVEEFLERRNVARIFPDQIFYATIKENENLNPDSYEKFLRTGLSSLVFYKIDNWNTEFLQRMAFSRGDFYKEDPALEGIKNLIDQKGEIDMDDIENIVGLIATRLEESRRADK